MTDARWLDETQQQAWRALLVFVNRGLPQLERTLKEHDLLVVHYAILVALSSAPDGTLRLADLADAANLSQSRLTHRIRTLTDRGVVEIAPDQEDGRGKNATLTKSGRRLLEAVAPLHVADVQRLFFDHLTPTETANVAAALSKVAASLCEHENFSPRAAAMVGSEGGDAGAEGGQAGGADAVAGARALDLTLDQAGVAENAEMLGRR